MPSRLNAPVLTLDAAKMHQIDPRNVESLFGMWTVFSKCSQSIKDGSRLENMSWRIWARETLCCPPQPEKTIVPAIDIPLGRASEVPSLSNSLASDDSGSENESPQRTSRHLPRLNEDSALSKSRGHETHLTPSALEKIVVTIQEKADLAPLSPRIEASFPPMRTLTEETPLTQLPMVEEEDEDTNQRQLQNSTDSCISGTTVITTSTTRQSDHRNSDTSVSDDGLIRSGSIVHGFSPISTSFRTRASNGLPVPASSNLAPLPAKKPGMFQLGASSEDDDNSSFEQKVLSLRPAQQRSSLSQSLSKQNLSDGGLQKKTTSFRDIVEQRRIQEDAENDEGAIASSDEEDDESGVDEDDEDGDWEDSNSEEDRAPAQPQHLFRRVDSRAGLVSRPSMLSMALDEKKRTGLQSLASRSSPAFRRSRTSSLNGPSLPGTPDEHAEENDEDTGLMMHGSKTAPRPIILTTTNNQHGMAHSPRTTRRNMLSTELTESLRKNLLWERQQKSQTANAFLKRSRNAQSMANLPAAGAVGGTGLGVPAPPQPGPPTLNKETSKNNSWNYYFDNPWEYNTKGW